MQNGVVLGNGHAELVERAREVLEHGGPKHRGERPQLGDRERGHLLIGRDEALQDGEVEHQVGLLDQRLRQRVDARLPRSGP